MIAEVELCRSCVLTAAVPGVTLHEGLCNFCREASDPGELKSRRTALAVAMREKIEQRRNRGEYDCVVAFSGGKDSSYTLLMLARDMGLNCLAVTVDNGFVSEQAMANCRTVASSLGVDLLIHTPSFAFMKNMYVKSVQDPGLHVKSAARRASAICNSCISLINTYMLKTAARNGIPIVAGGYVGGQVPQDAAALVVNLDRRRELQAPALERKIAAFGQDALRHFDAGAHPGGSASELLLINPMLTVMVSENDIIAAIGELGWRRTADTGLNSSNCKLNDVGVLMHYRQHRFHPYAFEISDQIRAGLMSREEGLRKVRDIPDVVAMSAELQKLELDVSAP
ncbi:MULTISPECIES: 7-cyano-7-deazaguanine synthase [unclassified Sphingomonas]|uniref:7-cyano-7-deazaguanine synthase n=1 Tax=unclassified Sphingomonas TaxID=196159 RepID=UPI00082AE286|nr:MULTISPECIES: 7-cyano-7-deazaguanine synthase [unclassified Sphingomonas]